LFFDSASEGRGFLTKDYGEYPMANEKTSKPVARIAGRLLSNPKTPKPVRRVAASALTQTANKPSKKKK
jgi:hypothetical protein